MLRETLNASLHVFMVSFPAQGHVNPLLRLGNFLASMGLSVTFCTTESFGEMMKKSSNNMSDEPIPVGEKNGSVRFEFFDDGCDYKTCITHPELFNHNLELIGKEKLRKMLKKHEDQGHPVCCVINNPFIPWVSDVAETLGIPNAMLWVQSCACFSAYYHYHSNLVPFPTEEKPELDVKLPCMPLLKHDEVPSFLYPSSRHVSFAKAILNQYKSLSKTCYILMDTFNELEQELIEYMSKLFPIKPIGPLFKYPAVSCAKIRGDIMKPDDCVEWLDLKPPSSVVYISFGTVVDLKQEQFDEIAYGLLNSKVSFLWVIKEKLNVLPKEFLEEMDDKGKIVQWSPQEQVLAHPSIACFLTHCGWNSTMEALTNGVPLLAFPQWGDQVTNAKYLVDEFNVGIRLCRGEAENKIISRHEIEKGLRESTSGSKAEEIKENALKWRNKAVGAVVEGGSSVINLQSFVDELSRGLNMMK